MFLPRFFTQLTICLAIGLVSPSISTAHGNEQVEKQIVSNFSEFQTIQTPRFTLHYQDYRESEERHKRAGDIATQALGMLNRIDSELTRILDYRPTHPVVLRFLSKEDFRRQTGAPNWTNAMFFRGEITIPVEESIGLDQNELYRALRHEYVHALVADFSGYRCPAWLDEGLAQVIEGDPNPLLGPALRKWVRSNDAMPLSWLENGFTTLNDSMVPAAYAQSLFATRSLINRKGFKSIKQYLQELRRGKNTEVAFLRAFGFPQSDFEEELTPQIARWANSGQAQP